MKKLLLSGALHKQSIKYSIQKNLKHNGLARLTQGSELVCIILHYSQEIMLAETVIFPREFNNSQIIDIPEGVKHIEIRKVRYFQELISLPESLKDSVS